MAEKDQIADLLPLHPIEVLWCDPSNLGTADCAQICRCEDGCDYAIKEGNPNPYIPHSEWFCTNLGERLGLAAPTCKIVKMQDGTLVFGSRWEGGIVTKPNPWWEMVKQGHIPFDDISTILTRIYVFDNFVHNVDRHAGNYLVREQRQTFAFLAFDYSRAWMVHGFPLPDLPFSLDQKTRKAKRQLCKHFGDYIVKSQAVEMLDEIRDIGVPEIERIINDHPVDWIKDEDRESILDWWGSATFLNRIGSIDRGIRDGSYL